MTTKIVMLAYPDMTPLDLFGPLQTWSLWPEADIQIVWKDTFPVMTDTGLAVVPTHSFTAAYETPDILFAPGGNQGAIAVLKDETVIEFLRQRGKNAGWVTSVCSGALLLGAAGLLDGYKATTHWMARDVLPKFGAIPTEGRYVIDRNRATGGGVTAGIDFGLALLAEIAGVDVAKAAQLAMEYAPQPPFDAGTPDAAGEEVVEQVRQWFSNG